MASAMSSSLLFKYWPNLMASSTVALLTSTFLKQNLLKDLAYSPVTGQSSGLSLSQYFDGCLSISCILYSCSLLTDLFNVTDTLTGFFLVVVLCIVISLALISIALVAGSWGVIIVEVVFVFILLVIRVIVLTFVIWVLDVCFIYFYFLLS